jgi:GAF domain-containing protein
LVSLLHRGAEPRDALYWVLVVISEDSRCESTAIRWREGEDYPYYVTRGMALDFVNSERSVCARDHSGRVLRDSSGAPRLVCLCGAVAGGHVDSQLPYFTSGGSFWTNSFTDLLQTDPPRAHGIVLRGRCPRDGYQSVALIPLRAEGAPLGLIQLNSREEGRFTEERIQQYEGLASDVAGAVGARTGS